MRIIFLTATLLLPLACLSQVPGFAPPNVSVPTATFDASRAGVLDRLQLTTVQLDYWVRYEAKLDAYSKLFYEEKPVGAYASDDAPRQFARLTDSLQNRLAALEDIETAAKALYSSLNTAQQAVANQSLMSTVPTFASTANCVPVDGKARKDRREATQRSRRGGAMSGPNASGGGPSNPIPGQY